MRFDCCWFRHSEPGQELVALIPHRDILVLLPGSLVRYESKLGQLCTLFEHGNHPPLLDRPVLVKHSGFEII